MRKIYFKLFCLILLVGCSSGVKLHSHQYGLYLRGYDEPQRIAVYDSDIEELAKSNCEAEISDYEIAHPEKRELHCQRIK